MRFTFSNNFNSISFDQFKTYTAAFADACACETGLDKQSLHLTIKNEADTIYMDHFYDQDIADSIAAENASHIMLESDDLDDISQEHFDDIDSKYITVKFGNTASVTYVKDEPFGLSFQLNDCDKQDAKTVKKAMKALHNMERETHDPTPDITPYYPISGRAFF